MNVSDLEHKNRVLIVQLQLPILGLFGNEFAILLSSQQHNQYNSVACAPAAEDCYPHGKPTDAGYNNNKQHFLQPERFDPWLCHKKIWDEKILEDDCGLRFLGDAQIQFSMLHPPDG
jgi:hypothetical protein